MSYCQSSQDLNNIYAKIVQQYPNALIYIPEKDRTREILIQVAKTWPESIKFMSAEEQTPEICYYAIQVDPDVISHVKIDRDLVTQYNPVEDAPHIVPSPCTEKYDKLLLKYTKVKQLAASSNYKKTCDSAKFKLRENRCHQKLLEYNQFDIDDATIPHIFHSNELDHIIKHLTPTFNMQLFIKLLYTEYSEYSHIEKILIDNKVDLNICCDPTTGSRPIHYAAKSGWIDDLIDYGVDINCADALGKTPLHYTVINKSAPNTQILLKTGANPNCKDNDGNTPLHCARTIGTTKLLLKYGADVMATNSYGETPLHMFCHSINTVPYYTCACIVPLMVRKNKSILECKNNAGETALVYCCLNTNYGITRQLLHLGADPNSAESLLAIMCNDDEIDADNETRIKFAELLINFGASIHWRNGLTDESLLHITCSRNNLDVSKWLIEKGIDRNARDCNGNRPIIHAINNNNMDLVRLLI
jgi:ankyrin repeat protein